MHTDKIKTLFLSLSDFSISNNGGHLGSAYFVERLANDPGLHLIVASMADASAETGRRCYVESLGTEFVFAPFSATVVTTALPTHIARRSLVNRILGKFKRFCQPYWD